MDLNNLLSEDTPQDPQDDMFMITVTGHVVPVCTIDYSPKSHLKCSNVVLKYVAALSSIESESTTKEETLGFLSLMF